MLLKYFDSCKEISGKKGLHIQITEMTALFSASFYLWMPLNLLPNTDRWGHEFWRKFPFWFFIAEMSAWKENSKHGFLYSENMASFVNFIRFSLPYILKSGAKTADFEEWHGHFVFLAFLLLSFCFSKILLLWEMFTFLLSSVLFLWGLQKLGSVLFFIPVSACQW